MTIYKQCDIRGEFGTEIRLEHASRLGRAIAALKGPGRVLVGGDGRVSTPPLKDELIRSLAAAGCAVVDLGMVPTPLFYFARERLGIETGVMVTASHNPAGDNGFKVTLGPLPVTPAEMQALSEAMETGPDLPPAFPGSRTAADLRAEYVHFAHQNAPDLSGMKIVADCGSGMAGLVAREVWAKTGAAVTFMLEQVDGQFPAHAPNPAEVKNLSLLQQAVRDQHADLGIAYDGDADRVAFVDAAGQAVPNDQVIVIFAREALRLEPGPNVYDQKCSRIVPDTIRSLGGAPLMELSGHTFIKRTFIEAGAAYAGELSGHHFFRFLGGDDGLLASIHFARILKESGKSLSETAAEIPSYPITPDIRLRMDPAAVRQVLCDLEANLGGEARITRTDGLRLEFERGWGLVRPSVTEPAVTLRFEAVTREDLSLLLRRCEAACPALRGKLAS